MCVLKASPTFSCDGATCRDRTNHPAKGDQASSYRGDPNQHTPISQSVSQSVSPPVSQSVHQSGLLTMELCRNPKAY